MNHDETFSRKLSNLRKIRGIIIDTIRLMLERRALRPDYGWIDLKLDAITGIDQFDISGVRDKDHIYSWIQGRGLEAIASHIQWFRSLSGIPTVDSETLVEFGHTVAQNLTRAKDNRGGHFSFVLSADFRHVVDGDDDRFTMSDLFCARGLFTFYRMFGTKEQYEEARVWIKSVVKAILSGNFYNDQRGFDDSQYQVHTDGRTSYAGHMIALGAVTLLIRLDADEEATNLGQRLVDSVIEKHMNHEHRWPYFPAHTIVEWIASDGNPARDENGCIALNPGHAVEFVGLVAQMIEAFQTSSLEDLLPIDWVGRIKDLLVPLVTVNLHHGYRKPGGIVTSVDAETGIPLHDSMPWWSLPEAMRAIALVEQLNNPNDWTSWGKTWFDTCLEAFIGNYREPSACKIAIQTIDTRGASVPIIPATPDLDPGYHTGLSLISCYEVVAKDIPMALDAIEVDITPELGTRLSGHAARTLGADRVLDPLVSRVCLLETPYAKNLLISADLLELSAESVDRLRSSLSELLNITGDHIIITTTHTHTAPPVIDLGSLHVDRPYFERMLRRIVEGCRTLGSSMSPVSVQSVVCSLPLGINRRYWDIATGSVTMRPNPSGSRDDEIITTVFRDGNDTVLTIWVNTAVHPTSLGVSLDVVSADYPGSVSRHLKQHFGDQVVVLPFTGACGDVRPALLDINKTAFREGTEEDVEQLGIQIAEELVRVLSSTGESSRLSVKDLRFARKIINCTFRYVPTREDIFALQETNGVRLAKAQARVCMLDDFVRLHDNPVWEVEVEQSWVDHLLQKEPIPDSINAELSVIVLGDSVMLCMVPGELFSAVGKRIKAMTPHIPVMVLGYANGSLGYLPGKEALNEGGYEVDVAYKYYGLSGPFTEDLEEQLLTSLKTLIGEVIHD